MPELARGGLAGVDVGGTFTDVIALDPVRGVIIGKTPTTPQDQSLAVVSSLEQEGLYVARLEQLVHGTTTATNATIERTGARCAVVATRGFRDIVELGRRDRPHLYGLKGGFVPLVPRRNRLEVGARMGPRGEELEPLVEAELDDLVASLRTMDVESVAICLMHAYANSAHEERVESVLRAAFPERYIVRSTTIYPEVGEFERGSTTVIAAYVGPIMSRYLNRLDARLQELGFGRDFMVVQSNGGASSHRVATRYPTSTIMSGPAAGVVAARRVAAASGTPQAVSFDMGGTSADIAVIDGHRVRTSIDNSLGYRLPLQVPMLEIVSIGAGGGSIAHLDDAGILRVGPRSAGALPGPACYGRGGVEPTVTDAQVVLGRFPLAALRRNHIASPDVGAAAAAVERTVAVPLGMSAQAAAEAITEVVNENMAGQIRLMTIDKGLDVRSFSLVAFGGAGPLHACGLLRKLQMGRALIPPYPGLTSALGTLMTDVRHDFVRSVRRRLDEVTVTDLMTTVELHRAEGEALLREQGIAALSRHEASLGMLYEGQRHTVSVELGDVADLRGDLRSRFEDVYRAHFGSTLDRPVVLVSLRTTVVAELNGLDLETCAAALKATDPEPTREVEAIFAGRPHRVPVHDRASIAFGATLHGPAIITQRDTTTLLEPGFAAEELPCGVLSITKESS